MSAQSISRRTFAEISGISKMEVDWNTIHQDIKIKYIGITLMRYGVIDKGVKDSKQEANTEERYFDDIIK